MKTKRERERERKAEKTAEKKKKGGVLLSLPFVQ